MADDQDIRSEIVTAISAGASLAAAARLAGLTETELTDHLAADPELATAIEQAEARREVANLGAIAVAARRGDWRAGAFLLERADAVPKTARCESHTRRCPFCNTAWAKCPHAHDTKGCKAAGHLCSQARGLRTEHPGTGHCWLHGGNTENGRKFAQAEAAENALARLGIPEQQDPVASLFEAVRVAAWRELGLRRLLQGRPRLFGPDHLGDDREDVVSQMHDRALDARAKIAKMAIDAGLDERLVRLAEGQGEVIHRILTAALDAAGVGGDARTKAEEAVIRELVAVGPGGDELN